MKSVRQIYCLVVFFVNHVISEIIDLCYSEGETIYAVTTNMYIFVHILIYFPSYIIQPKYHKLPKTVLKLIETKTVYRLFPRYTINVKRGEIALIVLRNLQSNVSLH